MLEPSRSMEGVTKFWYARTLLACIAAIAQRQGDAFGLIVCGDNRVNFTPASRGPGQMHRILAQLSRTEAAGSLPDQAALRASLHFARSPSLIFAVSDFLDWPSALSDTLIRLRHMQHDVRALCLQTQAELDADFSKGAAYRDPEQATGLYRFGPDEQQAYRSAHDAHFAHVKQQFRQHDITSMAACIEQTPSDVLRSWLKRAGRA